PSEVAGVSSKYLPIASAVGESGEVLSRRRLERTAPTRAAVSFEFDPSVAGDLTVTLRPAPELGLVEPLSVTVAWPLPPSPNVRSDLAPLSSLASAAGGDVYASAFDLPTGGRRDQVTWRSLPEVWLLLALGTFLASLTVRYGVLSRLSGLPG